MIYVKSVAAGIAMVVVAMLLSAFLVAPVPFYRLQTEGERVDRIGPYLLCKNAIGLAHCRRDIYGWLRLGISPCGRVVELAWSNAQAHWEKIYGEKTTD